jgi:hypothetical protein
MILPYVFWDSGLQSSFERRACAASRWRTWVAPSAGTESPTRFLREQLRRDMVWFIPRHPRGLTARLFHEVGVQITVAMQARWR